METQLTQPIFLVVKSILACALALFLAKLVGNTDYVTATFVAILCLSPTVLIGLRNAWAQLIGSFIGGIWGTLANFLGWPMMFSLPLAVGAAIATSFGLRVGNGYQVSAFTALFVIIVQVGTPLDTLESRIVALLIAGISAFIVNLVVSGMIYDRIYQRRLEQVESYVFDSLLSVVEGSQAKADQGFELLTILQSQLRNTLQELDWRKDKKVHQRIQRMLVKTQYLNYLLHLIWDLALLMREEKISQHEVAAFIVWIRHPDSENFPFLPDALLGVQKRIVYVLKQLDTQFEIT